MTSKKRLPFLFVAIVIIITVYIVISNRKTIEIPKGVQVIEFDSPSEYPEKFREYQAYTVLLEGGGALIYAIKGNKCLLEHELLHFKNGVPGHDNFPDYLMRCKL